MMPDLEVLLVAHVAVDRTCLKGRTRPKVSGAAQLVLNCLADTSPHVPFSWEWVAVYYGLLMPGETVVPALELARRAAQLSIEDLSFLPRETVFRMLNATHRRKKSTSSDLHLEATAA